MSLLISSDEIKARHSHSTKHFIDDLWVVSDDEEFGGSIFHIYPKEFERKIERRCNHGNFLNLDIIIKEGTFIYKFFDKRDSFPFLIVKMPHVESNIHHSLISLKNIFYSAIKGALLRITCSTLCLRNFTPKA